MRRANNNGGAPRNSFCAAPSSSLSLSRSAAQVQFRPAKVVGERSTAPSPVQVASLCQFYSVRLSESSEREQQVEVDAHIRAASLGAQRQRNGRSRARRRRKQPRRRRRRRDFQYPVKFAPLQCHGSLRRKPVDLLRQAKRLQRQVARTAPSCCATTTCLAATEAKGRAKCVAKWRRQRRQATGSQFRLWRATRQRQLARRNRRSSERAKSDWQEPIELRPPNR